MKTIHLAGAAAFAAAALLAGAGLAQDADLAVGRTIEGELSAGDRSDGDKQPYDRFRLTGAPGERVSVLLASEAFDTELEATLPHGTRLANDDDHMAGETTDSRLDLVMPAEGTVTVEAHSFRQGGSGGYTIRVVPTASLELASVASAPPQRIEIGASLDGELAEGEPPAQNGRHVDLYSFAGRQGQRLDLRSESRAFDTMLTLSGPDGFAVRNDDDATVRAGTLNSRILATLPADGTYTIGVTSFGRGETGAYRLATGINDSALADTEAEGGEGQRVAIGHDFTEMLGKDDETMTSGEYLDRYSFVGQRGQPVTVDLSSDEFDTYLIVRTPSGDQQDVDDTGESLNSRFERVLEEDGVYTVLATSFAPGATGRYRLAISEGTSRIPADPAPRQVFAISVGVADYGGNTSNLVDTDTDAAKLLQKLRELGVLRQESILLTNGEATLPAFRSAFAEVARQAGPDDMFLFFFSGHGSQIDDAEDAAELDRRDETLVFADGEELTDDELAAMFANVHAGTAMLVLDSCFSGGFERDVIARPDMMGLFSSEEDLTSLVASEFSAGGYLARFFSDAIGGQADDNGDGNVTAGELVSYLRYRFREQCNGRICIEAETGDAQRNHQELVVQRGSVEVDDILVVLPEQYGVIGPAR